MDGLPCDLWYVRDSLQKNTGQGFGVGRNAYLFARFYRAYYHQLKIFVIIQVGPLIISSPIHQPATLEFCTPGKVYETTLLGN